MSPSKRPSSGAGLPEGFLYRPEFILEEEEQQLLATLSHLHFQALDFQGYTAKRRVVEYGYEYDFTSRKASEAPPIPQYLQWLKQRAADFAGVPPKEIVEAVVTEYPEGAPIGWHRDVPQFEEIIGISLAGAARMRLKPYRKEGKPVSIILEPRSAYIMRGAARWQWQHSIPAVESLRYSITFRTLRKKRARDAA